MSAPLIHGNRKPATASRFLEAVADNLTTIKSEDRLTWKDIGEILNRSEDQAAKYADGSATMDFIAYARGKIAWGSRFSSGVDKLIEGASHALSGQQAQSCILKAALALALALEDGVLTDAEIQANRGSLEASRDAIDGLLGRLAPHRIEIPLRGKVNAA